MKTDSVSRCFLGANSCKGFYSLYDALTDGADGSFLWVIKGGPGCGKSTFMKRVGAAAEQAGERVEYIHCSGDPDSLDGVWLPDRLLGYVDGTAPHVQEPAFPGASGKYLDLGAFLDHSALPKHLDTLRELNGAYKAKYGEAYRLLGAAAALLPKNTPGLLSQDLRERTAMRAASLARRKLGRGTGRGTVSRRFLSAVSCQGYVRFDETLAAISGQTALLKNTLGLGHVFLDSFASAAAKLGWDVVACQDPLEPEKLEALAVPGAGLSLLCADKKAPFTGQASRRFLLDGTVRRELDPNSLLLLRRRERESALLLQEAMDALRSAKTLHDRLEEVYRQHVDFDGIDRLTKRHLTALGL